MVDSFHEFDTVYPVGAPSYFDPNSGWSCVKGILAAILVGSIAAIVICLILVNTVVIDMPIGAP